MALTRRHRSSIVIGLLAVGFLAVPKSASAQFEMSFSYYLDIVWNGTNVYGYATGYDGSWGCDHAGYYSYGWLDGPSHGTSGEGWGMQSSLGVGFGADDGTWTISIGTELSCSCAGSVSAGGSRQVQLTRVPTSVSVVSDEYTDPPPNPYNRRRWYQIRDQFGNPMEGYAPGLYVTETYTPNPPSGNCTSMIVTTGGNVYATAQGQFWDDYSLNGGPDPCSSSSTQRTSVNSSQVSTFSVTWNHDSVSIE